MIDLEKLRERVQCKPTDQGVYGPTWLNPSEALALIAYAASLEKDAGRLDFMQEEALDARCVELGEDSYGWQIMSHFMSEPKLRMVGESHDELGLRQAIDTAMESKHG